MKKFVLVLVFLIAASAMMHAQYATPHHAKRAGCSVKLDGTKLSQEETAQLFSDIDDEDYSDEWATARGWRTGGIVMISVGSGLALVGLGTAIVGVLISAVGATVGATAGAIAGSIGGSDTAEQASSQGAQNGAQAGVPYAQAGVIIGAVGAATAIAGIPITAVNCSRMNKIVDKYNNAQAVPAAELSFGPTQNGMGLRLNF